MRVSSKDGCGAGGAGPVTKLWPDILFRARSLEIRRHIGTDVENDCLRSELGAMR